MSGVRSTRSTARSALLVVLAVLVLPACSGAEATEPAAAPSTPPAAPSPEPVEPVVISVDPPLDSVDVAPVSPLRVAVGHGSLAEVTVTGDDGAPVPGTMDPSGASWTADGDFTYATTYAVAVAAVDAAGVRTDVAGTIATVAPRTLTMPTVFPTADTGSVGVGQPVSVTFDEDVTDRAAVERQLRVTTTPPVAGSWSWLSDRTVHYRPEHFWPSATHVAVDVDVHGVDVGNGIRGQASEHVEFDVGPKRVAVVDATELVLRIYEDDQLVRTMPTSLGKASSPTPTGTYVVMQQSLDYTMRSASYGVPLDAPGGYETPVKYASRLSNSGIFVHGAPWSVRDQGRRNVSHGCLNLSVADAGWFYEHFGRGDVVEVVNAGSRLEVGDGFSDWNSSWTDWQAGSALVRSAA